jgi:hypothetical protein
MFIFLKPVNPHVLSESVVYPIRLPIRLLLISVSRRFSASNERYPQGRAIAEADSRWLPTAAAHVQSRVWSSGICG